MKKFLTAAVAMSVLATAGVASAQPYQGRQDRYEQTQDRRDDRREERREDRADRRDDRREYRDDRRDSRYERRAERRYNAGRYHAPRGYQARSWHRGDRLPASYRANAYRVDYRTYRLAPPPRGYHYNRVGNDVVLSAVATGVIASVLVGMFN